MEKNCKKYKITKIKENNLFHTIMNELNIPDWVSLLTTILSIGLAFFSIWQYKESKNQEARSKAQVKIWMESANGLQRSLERVVSDNIHGRYSTTNDVCNTVFSLQASAFALYQSLHEERCVTEEEYMARQKRLGDVIEKKQLEQIKGAIDPV